MTIDFLTASKRRSLSITFEKTCRIVNDVVKPHPDFVIPRSYLKRPPRQSWTQSLTRSVSRSPSRKSNASRNMSSGSLAVSDSLGVSWRDNSSRSFLSEDDAREHPTPSSKHSSGGQQSGIQQTEQLPVRKRRHHRSSAGININNATPSNGGRIILQRTKGHIQSDGQLRPKSESISADEGTPLPTSPPSSQDDLSPASSTEDLSYANISMVSPSISKAKSLTPIMEHVDSFGGIVNPSTSSFVLPMIEEVSPIQFVDEHSGAIFARIDKANGGQVSADEFERNSLKSTTSLSLHIGSPPPAAVDDMHAHIASLPSFVLTIPTPEIPASPVFVPQVAFNPDGFLEAADASTPFSPPVGPRRPVSSPVPALPRCDHPVPDGEAGELCRNCEMQMLACRVWYQERDSGRRQSLREPLIRPGESTASNRALMEMLGLPAGPALGLGIDLNAAGGESDQHSDGAGLQERAGPEFSELQATAALSHNDGSNQPQEQGQMQFRKRLSRRATGVVKRIASLLRHEASQPPQRARGRNSDPQKLKKSARPTSFLALEDTVPVLGSRKLWRWSQ